MTSGGIYFNSWMELQSESHFQAGFLKTGPNAKGGRGGGGGDGMRKLTGASHVQNKVVHC